MAVAEQRNLFNPQVESLAEQYAKSMGQLAQQPFTGADITAMAPSVAPQTALQQQATGLTGAGIGAYSPYVTAAGQAGTAAGAALGQAGTQLGVAEAGLAGIAPYAAQTTYDLGQAQTAMGGAQQYITGAAGLTGTGAGTGAGSIASYMSPYQQQVIDTSLAEFDRQAAMRQQGISDAAVAVGGYGGGREGVMQAEYETQSDRNRAALQAQLQQQGFSQAQAARQADMASQLGIGGAQQQYAQGMGALAQGYLAPGQLMAGVAGQQAGMAGQRAGLGQAQLGLGQYELGQAGALQGFQGTDIARAGQVGAMDQAYAQAVRDADREKARMGLYEPMERMGFLGSGLTGLMGGMGPQYQFATQPNPSPLATALGIGATGAGIYGALQNPGQLRSITPFSG
jgi:hypothetical protein